jgi:hypothetical protein
VGLGVVTGLGGELLGLGERVSLECSGVLGGVM